MCSFLLACALAHGARPVSAQAPAPSSSAPAPAASPAADPATTAAARALFERGVAAADAGDHATAAELLARSHALRASPVVAFNLAESLVVLGRLVEASETLAGVERDATHDELRVAAAERRAELARRIPLVTVVVRPTDTEVEVRLDGTALAPALRGIATPTDPGVHVATALRDGEEIARVEASLAEGQRTELALLVPAPVAPPPVSESGGDDTALIAVLTGVGVLVVAGLAVGLGVGLNQGGGPVEGNLSPPILRFGQ